MTPTLYSSDDMLTVNEVFCREDYRVSPQVGVAVDIGANIGLSALYFLTRGTRSRCYLFEPDLRNSARLDANLADFQGRFTFEEAAVGLESGSVAFSMDPTGRYGRIGEHADWPQVQVRCIAINEALGEILRREAAIDVVKIDVEGLEVDLVEAIRPELLARIGIIYYETGWSQPRLLDRFDHSFSAGVNRLARRVPLPAHG
jgi:FkbM family methyltransferase